ncbi:hypothetical protein VNI00_017553 [Paramarasmius palmivorus]|uniref:Uncharacterized protein n=1 Tax=Paramarasmius palmivorus TaxID=297713 RepID=A0AAW0B669_9AGAR
MPSPRKNSAKRVANNKSEVVNRRLSASPDVFSSPKTSQYSNREQKKLIVVDDAESDGSVVMVSRNAAPVERPVTPVNRFGSVESDEDVFVRVANTRPNRGLRQHNGGDVEVDRNSDMRLFRNASSDVDVASNTGSSTEAEMVLARKRRASEDKKHGQNGGESDDEGSGKRASGRSRKPTQRAANAGGTTSELLSKLDALVPDSESERETKRRESDESYKPFTPRKRSSVRAGSSNNQKKPEPRGGEDQDSDASMRSPVPSDVPGYEKTDSLRWKDDIRHVMAFSAVFCFADRPERQISESDDELPSPSTIFSRQGHGSGVDMRGKGSPLPPVLSRVDAHVSRRRPPTPVNKKSTGDTSSLAGTSDQVAPTGHSGNGQLPQEMAKDSPRQGRGAKHLDKDASVRSEKKERGTSPSKGDKESPSASYSMRDAAVFLPGVVIPEDEEDYEEDDDVQSNQGAPNAAAVVPLLKRECIHPDLVELYDSLTWINSLRRAKFIGYSNTEDAFDDFIPVSYGGVVDKVNNRVRSKLVRSVIFVEYRDFKSPVRVPLMSFVRSWECIRVPHAQGTQNAVFIFTGICHRSFVSQGREVGESYVKQLHIRPMENDWEIFQCNLGTYFNDNQMHAPGRYSAVVFQTKRKGWTPRRNDRESDKLASTPYSSPAKGGSSSAAPSIARGDGAGSAAGDTDPRRIASVNVLVGGAPPYRLFDDGIPLYDGKTTPGTKGFQFGGRDWEKYHTLPTYPYPEVEEGSLVTVAFTITGFRGSTNSHHTVHFNALFAIVLGKVDM